ncbi:MAG: AmmeMemoRadiSam system radical SAM enzyme [Actinobacteria bacterium]|nr:AmmeMemoRadiSam system radical SAM enzyme [Actinomycetota bacterium]MBM3713790.1 AmmeMemoRadiSam system radical SAM enzyme [Actinomycetota bacterium]
MKEAYLYNKLDKDKVRCNLCSHRCVIENKYSGRCSVRKNDGGLLYSLVYDKIISENVDPIEKKPLFHFLPGTMSLSIATPGCNFKCFFCQNWQISQMPCDYDTIEGKAISPEKLVKDAQLYNCESISYTYTEPTVYFELAYDTARLASEKGIKNVFVTNGFMTKECLEMVRPYLDAANIDLKSFSDDFYRKKVDGRLKPVLDNIRLMHEFGIWIEVTTLLIPGLNDSVEELESLAKFLTSVSDRIPWHISAYYPQYKSDIPQTEISSIVRAIDIGKKAGLKYIYGGNIPGSKYENTSCPDCKEMLIERHGFSVINSKIKNNVCAGCGAVIDGVF